MLDQYEKDHIARLIHQRKENQKIAKFNRERSKELHRIGDKVGALKAQFLWSEYVGRNKAIKELIKTIKEASL